MSSTDLFDSRESVRRESRHSSRKHHLPSWLLPAFLVLAFGVIFLWFFRHRILPAQPVTVSPVILLSDIEAVADRPSSPQTQSEKATSQGESDFSAPMLFQAAGWFEPDPLPIRATALVDGVVESVHVLEGETVSKGQLLAKLIVEDAELLLDSSKRALEEIEAEHHMHLATIPAVEAEAQSVRDEIKAAEVKLEEMEDRYERIRNLSAGTVSDQEVTAARLAVESQTAKVAALKSEHAAKLARLEAIESQSAVFEARIAAARVAISQNELARSRTEIVSPVDGVVLELKAAPGQKKLLKMDDPDSATIAILFETGKLQARVDVALAEARGLVPGQAALITTDFLPNREFRGRVTRIVGSADLQRNTLQAKVRVLDPDPRLRPEMLCRVKFLQPLAEEEKPPAGMETASGGTSRAVFAPLAGLFDRSGERASVWVVRPDGAYAARKEVTLGEIEIDDHIAIESGLVAGEQIILPPHTGLSEGRRIRISDSQS